MTVLGNNFGVNIWWHLPEMSIDGLMVQRELVKHGFEADDIKLPTRQKVVRMAADSFHNRKRKSNRHIVEKIRDNKDEVLFGILDLAIDGSKAAYDQNTTVALNKNNGEVIVKGVLKDEVDKVLPECEGKITEKDLSLFLRRVVTMCYGTPKRVGGGMYFIPSKFMGIINQAESFIKALNSSAILYVERVMDGQQERQNIWDSVEEDLDKRVSSVVAAIGRIDRRMAAVKTQSDNLKASSELMEVYQQLLGDEVRYEEMIDKISQAGRLITTKMDEINQLDAVKKIYTPKNINVKTLKGSGVSIVDAAIQVLSESGVSMNHKEIMDKAVAKGLYHSNSNDPYNSFHSALCQAIRRGDGRIQKVGRGLYEVA